MGKKITFDDIEMWREKRDRGYSYEDIGNEFNVSAKTVSKYLKETELYNQNYKEEQYSTSNTSYSTSELPYHLENDEDIIKLQKELEITKLKQEIQQIKSPLEIEKNFYDFLHEFNEWKRKIDSNIAMKIDDLNCTCCGSEKSFSIYILCKHCNTTMTYGYINNPK